jgi:putative hydrolase of the HAD superfamily
MKLVETPDTTRGGGAGMRYDAVFLDVDGTLLWVDLDVEGYVEDLSPYAGGNGGLTTERAAGPVWGSLRRHIRQNIEHRTGEDLARFRRRNAERTAEELGIAAPSDVLTRVAERRISFNPYPESVEVLEELKGLSVPLYVVSNWDIELERVLRDLGWMGYFYGIVASAVLGFEKPRREIFDEALRLAGVTADRAIMVGNDPVSDVRGASEAGVDSVFVARKDWEAPEATHVLPDLRGLPGIVRG